QGSAKSKSLIYRTKLIQPIEVNGTVTDDQNNPLPGVTIRTKDGEKGTSSGADGKFSITVPDDAILVVSFVGYQKQEVSVNGRKNIDVILKKATAELEQLVVVGYGKMKNEN